MREEQHLVMANAHAERARSCSGVQLRPFPYPYRCMLAICSDLDGTPHRRAYLEIARFLNTEEMTPMGSGVGLEVGNSIHFRAKTRRFAYWSTDDAGREMVRMLIRSGHIDCLHSFGERIHTRDEAKRAVDELRRHDCHLEVWVDHGGAVTNFGPDIMRGHGDEIGHPAYHADATVDYGIQYVCLGRGTSIMGQDIPAKLRGILTLRHPIASGRTLLKEVAKQSLARIGNTKYAMHASNRVLRPSVLRDGQRIYEFMRCNPHWAGVGSYAEGRYIGNVLTADRLQRLVTRGGTCILYTHLGRVDDPAVPFDAKAVGAFRHLAEESRAGKILVATTRRLLGYRRAVCELVSTSWRDGNVVCIDLNTQRSDNNWLGPLDVADLAGVTFYVADAHATCLTVNGEKVRGIRRNPPDHTGRPSVSLPWPRLEFPAI